MDACKPLVPGGPADDETMLWFLKAGAYPAHFTAQLEDLRVTSLMLELNLSTLGTHPRVNLGHMWDKVSLS